MLVNMRNERSKKFVGVQIIIFINFLYLYIYLFF